MSRGTPESLDQSNVAIGPLVKCVSWRRGPRSSGRSQMFDAPPAPRTLYLPAKGAQTSKAAMNEYEWLSLTALEVVKRRPIDLDSSDFGATRLGIPWALEVGGWKLTGSHSF